MINFLVYVSFTGSTEEAQSLLFPWEFILYAIRRRKSSVELIYYTRVFTVWFWKCWITDSYRHSSNESISGNISTKTGAGSEYTVVILPSMHQISGPRSCEWRQLMYKHVVIRQEQMLLIWKQEILQYYSSNSVKILTFLLLPVLSLKNNNSSKWYHQTTFGLSVKNNREVLVLSME